MDPLDCEIDNLNHATLKLNSYEPLNTLYSFIDTEDIPGFLAHLSAIDIDILRDLAFTPLMYAIQEQKTKMIDFLLSLSENSQTERQTLISTRKSVDFALLDLAGTQNDQKVLQNLILKIENSNSNSIFHSLQYTSSKS
ncbi:hypothetical protein SS50377_20877 [Spironucleus salmonicida]|uniref:Ankyrin repeat-containing protein n=1 Tax=Spironucleus salmonicida TaxID=348837 RepID=V6LGX0_9EUKA|nr:hypothetical protein SS50377_20877 [Spironucleus salmonicida]|eukprot:EST43553.1 Hypothetical protein SS50377_16591 [Spironucleus salmonicida]